MKRRYKILVCLIAVTLIVSALTFAVFAQSEDTPTNVITTFEGLKVAFTNATGTADDPTKIYISGMIKQNEKLAINDGQYIHLIGVGEGENGLIRESIFSGDMIDVGNGNNGYVCGLILDNIVLDGGAVWEDGAGSTNSGINAGNSSIVSVRQQASLTIDNGTILRNNCKGGGGSGVYLRGKMEIINGSVLNNATTGSNNGGGILMRDSTTELILGEHALIGGNYSSGDGGGIFQQSGGTLTIRGAKINNNTVANGKSGGAIFTKGSNAKVYVTSGEMTGNIAGNNGSAIYVSNAISGFVVELFNCNIHNNNALGLDSSGNSNADGGVGAVWVNNSGTVRLGGSLCITENEGANGESNLYISTDGALTSVEIAQFLTNKASIGLSYLGDASDGRQIAKKSDDFSGDFSTSADAFYLDALVENMVLEVSGDTVVISDITAKGCECESGGFTSGNGTINAPYSIVSLDDLMHLEKHPEACYILDDSIDLSAIESWTPLCAEISFTGNFNGNGKIISGMSVSEGALGGLFASVENEAVIYNVTVTGEILVGSSMTHAGGLAAISYGTVKQITSNVNVTVSADAKAKIGGIVGFNGGTVILSAYSAAIEGKGTDCSIGAIIGHSEVTNTPLLPGMITAHAGFGAASDSSSLKQDNTIDNIILSINYGPDAIEVDVRGYDADGDGVLDELRIGHDASHAVTGASLKSVLELLAGNHERSSELNSAYASKVRIQLDTKENGILDEIFALLDEIEFPYSRIILAGDNNYSHVEENIEKIRTAVDQGMDFWMNPNYILSYTAMANQTDEFIDKIEALGLSSFTVNSSYSSMTEQIQRKLHDAGIKVSIWTLNSTEVLNSHILRGVYNITTRMQESLVIRDQIIRYGTSSNTITINCLPEVGLCTTSSTEEKFEICHTEVVDAAVAPTCTESGKTEGKHCSECNEVLVAQESVDALGHDFADATTEAPKTCKTCGATEGDKLPTPELPDEQPETPNEPEQPKEELNFFQRIWLAIVNFFKKLFGIK